MNFRKTVFHFIAATSAALLTAACAIDDVQEVPLVKLGAFENEFTVAAEGAFVEMEIYTNSSYHIERTDEDSAEWLTYSIGEPEDGMALITMECSFNEGFKRKGVLVLCSDLDERRDTIYVKQKSFKDAVLTLTNSSIIVPGAGGTSTETITTNVPFEELTVEITYSDEDSADWITELSIADSEEEERTLTVVTEANTDEEAPRVAIVELSFTDGWDESVVVEFNLIQRTANEAIGREITFKEFRENYAMNETIKDYVIIEGIVVSNTENRNAGENTQSTTSSIDYTISARTVYLESYDGTYGISILLASEDDNVFSQYDHTQIMINGTTGILKESPDRYEIEGVTNAMVISCISGSAADVPVKQKHMADLTDDDIYTYVSLIDVELPVRKGSLMPINEGYAIGTNADRISKFPLLMRDINGDSMYLLTNTNCTYRSDGSRLPYGSGTISGVIVHEQFPRFEWRDGADPNEMEDDSALGYIGEYQIRHQSYDDIWLQMNDSVEDSFSGLLVEYRFWNPDVENQVLKPTYGTNGYLTHTYQKKYTGTDAKNYTSSSYQQHLGRKGTYDYLGPVGNNSSYYFGANYGNKNGIGVVLDLNKEYYNSGMEDLVSFNPDGTVEWCGPYAASDYAACGTGGWTSNSAISTSSNQINYSGSTSLRGKGQVSSNCYCGWGNDYWWDDDTGRPYGYLLNFSTEGINTTQLSLQISVLNSQQTWYAPRYWKAEWAYTDSQAEEDDTEWTLIGEYTVPDVSVWSSTLFSSIAAFKPINFDLPLEILGHENVYIRMLPVSDVCSDGSDYANAVLSDSASGTALYSEHASSMNYLAIRYNK